MLNQVAALTLRNYQVDLMVSVSKDSFGTYDFDKAAEIIREGQRATSVALEDKQRRE